MHRSRAHRRASTGAAVATALLLSGGVIGTAIAGPYPTEPSPPPTSAPTTAPTMPTTPPSTTAPTTTWTSPDPTSTPTWPTTTSPTVPPPRCVDPGPRPGIDYGGDSEPAVGPTGGSAVNDQIIDVGTAISTLVADQGHLGFAGLVAEPALARLRLYWLAGEPLPPDVAGIVASPGHPVDVVREDAPHSRSELEPIAESLLTDPTISDRMCGFLHRITVLEEGTGLVAGIEPYDTSFDPVTAAFVLNSSAGVPVMVEVEAQSVPTGRLDDRSPWSSGARITAGRGQCSTAFGIVDAGTRTRHYMLTAEHCFTLGTQVRNGDGTRVLGPVALSRPIHDSEVIRVDAAGTDTFFGGVGLIGAAERSAAVRRTAANVRGTTVACTSGASTGENCALDVFATNVQFMRRVLIGGRIVRNVVVQTDMVMARSTVVRRNGQLAVAVGQGDSGGPVVTDTSMDRRALGTISAGNGPVGCGLFADPGPPPKQCFSTVIYADIDTLLRSYVAALR